MSLYIHGLGHFHPENEVSNRFLEELDIGTTDDWIVDRVGIRARRTVLPLDYIRSTQNQDVRAAAEAALYTNAQMGARAAELAIQRAGVEKSRIGMVLSGSSAPSTVGPAEAAFVAPAGPATGLWVAASGIVLIAALALEVRVVSALARAGRELAAAELDLTPLR